MALPQLHNSDRNGESDAGGNDSPAQEPSWARDGGWTNSSRGCVFDDG
jgi:hypothetical protein